MCLEIFVRFVIFRERVGGIDVGGFLLILAFPGFLVVSVHIDVGMESCCCFCLTLLHGTVFCPFPGFLVVSVHIDVGVESCFCFCLTLLHGTVFCPFPGFVVLSVHIDIGVESSLFLFHCAVWNLLLLAFLYFPYIPFV